MADTYEIELKLYNAPTYPHIHLTLLYVCGFCIHHVEGHFVLNCIPEPM